MGQKISAQITENLNRGFEVTKLKIKRKKKGSAIKSQNPVAFINKGKHSFLKKDLVNVKLLRDSAINIKFLLLLFTKIQHLF